MVMALQINISGATTFRDSTKKMLAQIEQNTMNEAFQLTKLVQEDIIRNSRTMIPHKYSSLNRMNNGNVIPLAKSINLVRTKKSQYSIMVPKYAIALDKGAKVNVKKGNPMGWINQNTLNKNYATRVIHPGNPAYFFISTSLARLPKLAEDAGYRITKKNQRFYK